MKIVYEIGRWLGVITGYPFNWLFFKTKLYYENERVPRGIKGGALMILNHFNPLDFVMSCFLVFPRKLYVVASEHAFKNAFLRFGMKFWGGIEANRVTRSMRFVAQSIREIKKGHVVLIFPEGHNTDDGTIKAFYPSYLLIALRSGALIVPYVSDGNYGIFKRLHVIKGEEIDLTQYLTNGDEKASKEDIARLNDIVRNKMLALRAELDARIAAEKKGKKV